MAALLIGILLFGIALFDVVRWENDVGYCGYLKKKLSAKGPRLLDLIDMAISDYLIDNTDRHEYHTFTNSSWGPSSAVIMIDNSKR